MALSEISVYVHVPFCLARCSYCDFYSVTDLGSAEAFVERTLADLAEELARLGRPRIRTVYVGGGTPSALPHTQLARLLEGLQRRAEGAAEEVTVEANPETVTSAFIQTCLARGVTRLSMGVQSLSPELLTLLGRRARASHAHRALELIRESWPHEWSVDLLCGIPGQSRERLLADVAAVLAYGARHVSLYSLTREEGTEYDRKIGSGELREPTDEEQESLWLAGARALVAHGLRHYEISNFASRGSECRHNLRIWSLHPYLGVGPAAVSTLPGGRTGVQRATRPRDLAAYLAGAPPLVEEIGAREFLFENLLMGLRVAAGIRGTMIRERFGPQTFEWLVAVWRRLAARCGTRLRRGGRLALTRRGWLLLTRALESLLEELPQAPVEALAQWPNPESEGAQGARARTGSDARAS